MITTLVLDDDSSGNARQWGAILGASAKSVCYDEGSLHADGTPLAEIAGIVIAHQYDDFQLEGLRKLAAQNPQMLLLLVSGSGLSAVSEHPRIYFRKESVGKPTDPSFSWCWQRFAERVEEQGFAHPQWDLIEPQGIDECLLCYVLAVISNQEPEGWREWAKRGFDAYNAQRKIMVKQIQARGIQELPHPNLGLPELVLSADDLSRFDTQRGSKFYEAARNAIFLMS